MKDKFICTTDKGTIEYIGYYAVLDKIASLMDKVSREERLILIDKYIEIAKIFNK